MQELLRPSFGTLVPSDQLFDREFDRFELLLSICYFSSTHGESGSGYVPAGKFGRFGRYGRAFHKEAIVEMRQAANQRSLLDDLEQGALEGTAKTLAAYDAGIQRILNQVF